ncbi:MAG: ABC transporter ATP-binding protein [Kiritimatiellae bacterium]|nr:ABC transporter ATP-binding protein [Kiritimatiellia bacterium]
MAQSGAGERLVEVTGLRVQFASESGPIRAVDGVDLTIPAGRTVALVGESGCGKSVTALSLCRLNPEPPARYAGGAILYRGSDILAMDRKRLAGVRGGEIAYIFQDPGASLNPVFRVGAQIAEAVHLHQPDLDADAEAIRLMGLVGLPDPARRARAYPHELSGGMQQRAMIAMALGCRPRLLVADEPTTALDVTIQAQILELLAGLQAEFEMAVLLITHNLGLVADVSHAIYVMYAGRIVEAGPTERVLLEPAHPYTRALLAAVPRLEGGRERRAGIPGTVPHPARLPPGCRYHPRCPKAESLCRDREPDLTRAGEGHEVRCHFWK